MRTPPLLGIITNNQYGVFQRNVITGVKDVAARRGYEVVVHSQLDMPATPLEIDVLAGVLIIANAVANDDVEMIYRSGVPVSLVCHQVPGLPIPAVMSNNVQGIGMLVKHLLDGRRRRFVFIRGHREQNDQIQREAAFRRELMRYNLEMPEHRFLSGEFEPETAARSLRELLEYDRDFDAIIAADYLMAEAAIRVLEERGMHVPDEVSVVGFGDGPEAAAAGITTVAADIIELGRRGARQLIGQVEGLRIRGTTVLSVELVSRATSRVGEKIGQN
jgi:LacI family transcriptional regulator